MPFLALSTVHAGGQSNSSPLTQLGEQQVTSDSAKAGLCCRTAAAAVATEAAFILYAVQEPVHCFIVAMCERAVDAHHTCCGRFGTVCQCAVASSPIPLQAAALGFHLAKQFPALAQQQQQQQLVHSSTAIRAAKTAAIALEQFQQGAVGQVVVQSTPELLELSQGSWVRGCCQKSPPSPPGGDKGGAPRGVMPRWSAGSEGCTRCCVQEVLVFSSPCWDRVK